MENNNRKLTKGKIALGIVLFITGVLLFSRNMGVNIPDWLISWPMLLIAIGLISGINHQFRRPASYILILAGTVFLTDKLIPGYQIHELLFPLAITGLGIFLIFRRNRHWGNRCWHFRNKPEV